MAENETRPATPEEIEAYERGDQHTWECPECGHTSEMLGAIMAFCGECRRERSALVQMRKV